mmetsp:Transcript_45100/g.74753  ORF Transcript_45100/g.74753 Transcript_45100/m.74753 type:complete len:402 (-) Transcript_45100:76-1281(-)
MQSLLHRFILANLELHHIMITITTTTLLIINECPLHINPRFQRRRHIILFVQKFFHSSALRFQFLHVAQVGLQLLNLLLFALQQLFHIAASIPNRSHIIQFLERVVVLATLKLILFIQLVIFALPFLQLLLQRRHAITHILHLVLLLIAFLFQRIVLALQHLHLFLHFHLVENHRVAHFLRLLLQSIRARLPFQLLLVHARQLTLQFMQLLLALAHFECLRLQLLNRSKSILGHTIEMLLQNLIFAENHIIFLFEHAVFLTHHFKLFGLIGACMRVRHLLLRMTMLLGKFPMQRFIFLLQVLDLFVHFRIRQFKYFGVFARILQFIRQQLKLIKLVKLDALLLRVEEFQLFSQLGIVLLQIDDLNLNLFRLDFILLKPTTHIRQLLHQRGLPRLRLMQLCA